MKCKKIYSKLILLTTALLFTACSKAVPYVGEINDLKKLSQNPETYTQNLPIFDTNIQKEMDDKFNKENYVSERIWAKAKDGTKIPISLVYKKGIKKDGNNPLLLYGYGSYGNTIDPSFSISRFSEYVS